MHSFNNSLHRFRKATVHCCLGDVQPSCLRISISCCLGISQLCCLRISQSCCLGISQSCCLGIFQPCCLGNDQLCSQRLGCSVWLPTEGYFQLVRPEGGYFGKTAQKEEDSAWLPRQDYYKVETKGLMEEAMMFKMKNLRSSNFFSLADCISGILRLFCVLQASRIFLTELAESFPDECAGTRQLAATATAHLASLSQIL